MGRDGVEKLVGDELLVLIFMVWIVLFVQLFLVWVDYFVQMFNRIFLQSFMVFVLLFRFLLFFVVVLVFLDRLLNIFFGVGVFIIIGVCIVIISFFSGLVVFKWFCLVVLKVVVKFFVIIMFKVSGLREIERERGRIIIRQIVQFFQWFSGVYVVMFGGVDSV